MPFEACTLFGPITPPVAKDQLPIRPRDPDITGGYYLPVRVSLWIPEPLRRPGMAGEDTLVGFELERIACGLANAPPGITRDFNATYTSNQNPHLAGVNLTDDTNPVGVQLLVRGLHLRVLEQVAQVRDVAEQRHLRDVDRVLRLDDAADHHRAAIGHQYLRGGLLRDQFRVALHFLPKLGVVFSTSTFRKMVFSDVICGVTVNRRKAST
jgi:hypothetical protein